MLGQRIHELRQAFGWSQVELAKRLNISKQTISNWENDNIQPSVDMLVRLSKIFGTTTDYLLGLENTVRVDMEGVPVSIAAHISMLVDDYRNK